jgi:mono/diheme cytochrome c family protein
VNGLGRLLRKPWAAGVVAALAVGASIAVAVARHIPDPGLSPGVASRTPDAKHGAYVAILGDCASCHTAAGGKPLAGGRAFNTPVGAVWSTNITPDPDHGIGRYSLADFVRLMRQGVRADGRRVYPAMPYTAFAKVSDDDLQDLFAYLTRSVAPADTANRTGLWPPRWPLAFWNIAFHQDRRFAPDPHLGAQANRGAYLVQGLAHCGTCHTPRGAGFQEKDLDGRTNLFLSGSRLDGASPINLRGDAGDGLGRWTRTDIVELLATGKSAHSAVLGPLCEVVVDSTRHMTPADLDAIAAYLKTLSPAQAAGRASFVASDATLNEIVAGRQTDVGGRIYMDSCAACHRLGGEGAGRSLPSLAGNSVVLDRYPDSLIDVILRGDREPGTAAARSRNAMPPFDWRYDDQEVAALATYMRQAWGNRAPPVQSWQVRNVRHALGIAQGRKPG